MEHIPCENQNECPLKECFEDKDHFYFPASFYRTSLEKAFRRRQENITLTCRDKHNERHATEDPPLKPSVADMRAVIKGIKRAKDVQDECRQLRVDRVE